MDIKDKQIRDLSEMVDDLKAERIKFNTLLDSKDALISELTRKLALLDNKKESTVFLQITNSGIGIRNENNVNIRITNGQVACMTKEKYDKVREEMGKRTATGEYLLDNVTKKIDVFFI